jgi:hypothetical protein
MRGRSANQQTSCCTTPGRTWAPLRKHRALLRRKQQAAAAQTQAEKSVPAIPSPQMDGEFAQLLQQHTRKRAREEDEGRAPPRPPAPRQQAPRRQAWRGEAGAAESDRRCLRAWPRAWPERRLAAVRGRWLVVVPAGDGSLHDNAPGGPAWQWHGQGKGFDLCIVYFGTNAVRAQSARAAIRLAPHC